MKRTSILLFCFALLVTCVTAQTGSKTQKQPPKKQSILLTPPILKIEYTQPSDAVPTHIGKTYDGKILTTTTRPQNIDKKKNVTNKNVFTNVTLDATKGFVLLTPAGMQSKAINDSVEAATKLAIENERFFQEQKATAQTLASNKPNQPSSLVNTPNKLIFNNLVDNKQAASQNYVGNEVVDTLKTVSDEVPSLLTPVIPKINKPQGLKANSETIDPSLLAAKLPKANNAVQSSQPLNNYSSETVDPSLLNPTKATINLASNYATTTVMPELVAIEGGKTRGYTNTSVMPELAPIEGKPTASYSSNTMPQLAPIEGTVPGSVQGKPTTSMPQLAPIYEEQTLNANNALTPISTNNPNATRGMEMPKGTVLAAQKRVSYVFKPAVPQTTTTKQEFVENYKPGAGGGYIMPELEKIENSSTNSTSSMPALALIEQQAVATNYYTQQQPVRLAAAQPVAPKKVAAQQPCNCPTVKKKKWYPPKKKYYYKPPVQPTVKYVEQPSQTIVYVPVQQQQQTSPAPAQQPVYQQPVQQQPKDNFTYRDYTNTYKKEQNYKNPCNCGTQSSQPQQTKPSIFTKSEDPSVYYDPTKYSGVSAGPTSGDYPVNPTDVGTDLGMRYTFFVNRKGEYSVKVYNSLMDVLIRQDGKVIEYNVNGTQDANAPKNYFGSIDNLAGVPITYNYNRSINRIGNLDFTYDFEGFIKTIGGTPVVYNNRSKLSQVGNVHVTYNGNAVSGVTPNNNLVVFTNN